MNRMQIQQRIREERRRELEARALGLEELAHAVDTGCACHQCRAEELERPAPAPVPELLRTTGGFAVVVGDRVTADLPWADAWGSGR